MFQGQGVMMDNPFQAGDHYRNAKGEYEVVSINGDTMLIRWTDGSTWEGKVSLQARILERTQRQELGPEPPPQKPRRRMARATRGRPRRSGTAATRGPGPRMPPASSEHLAEVTQALLAYGETIDPARFDTVIPEAADLVLSNLFAFALATCFHRQMKAEVIWTIPYDIKVDLGHLDPFRIHQMSLSDLASMFSRLPRRPRFVNDAPRTVQDLTRIVVQDCEGDASRIWVGKRASEVKRTFASIHGVGPEIASMAVLLLERRFPIRFDDLDRPSMDIRPSVNTVRVLYRLGASREETKADAVETARLLNPSCPGELDEPLLWIGRDWCFATDPDCGRCPVELACARRLAW